MPRKKEWLQENLLKLPRNRGVAAALNMVYFFNGNLCKEGHVAPRRTADGKCSECVRIRNRNRMRRLSAEKRKIPEWVNGHIDKGINLIALVESGLPCSREEAIKIGSNYYYTGKPCKNNHKSPRRLNGSCMLCTREKQQARGEDIKERHRQKVDIKIAKAMSENPKYVYKKSRSLAQILYNSAQQRAHKKGIEFSLSVEDIEVPSRCPILGIELSKIWGAVDMNNNSRGAQPSLDRIDPRKGYVPGNVIVISYRANMIKGDGLPEEHRAIAKYIEELKSKVTET